MDQVRRGPAATGLIALALLDVACGGGSQAPDGSSAAVSWSRDPEMMAVEIVVDLNSAHDHRIPVEVIVTDGRPTHFAIQSAWSDGYSIHELRFTDGEGRPIPHEEERGKFRVDPAGAEVVKASYEMKLGGEGRHGMQGVVAEDHALFDGRLFLLPQAAVSIGSARIRFDAPEGWSVGSPFREDGGWYHVDAFKPELTAAVLGASCIGVGRFDHVTGEVGRTEVRVASYSNWTDEHKQFLADHTYRMLAYYHETLGFDLEAPYSAVWVPRQGRQRVFGGSFSNGTCYDNPTGARRNWELLAHRLAHSMNHYVPSGMRIRDEADSWFKEGWASYMEATATRGAGLEETEPRWRHLLASYYRIRMQDPGQDIPLSSEKRARGETKEYLHYVKGPLAVKMLEHLVVARSGRSLEQFMAAMWRQYGWYARPFPLREELERFTGVSFDDFWSMVVAARGDLIPVWEEYLTPTRLRSMEAAPAATVGDEPLQGDYLHHLAWSGDFRTYEEIREFLIREAERRRALTDAGIRLYPDWIRDHLYGLAAGDRYALARLEASYPLDRVVERTGSEGRDATPGAPRLQLHTDHRDGRIFAELLAHERGVEAPQVREGGPWIEARTPSRHSPGVWRSRLTVDSDEPIEVAASRLGEVSDVTVAVQVGDGSRVVKRLDTRSGGERRTTVAAEDRPSGDRVIVLRLEADGERISRAFWQRASLPWVPVEAAVPAD